MLKRMHTHADNGGFPEPPAGEPQRLVRARHAACGSETRVRLPSALPARTVRQVVCQTCSATYECDGAEELRLMTPEEAASYRQPPAPPSRLAVALARFPELRRPNLRLPDLPSLDSRIWRYGSVAIAAAAVIAILALIQGGDERPATVASGSAEGGGATTTAGSVGDPASTQARFVTEPGFSGVLPAGWERTATDGGAAFSAQTVAGNADATLWIENDPTLSFKEFEERSIVALESLAGSMPEVVERIAAPTLAGSIVRLRVAPAGSPAYEVTLRAAGPYRYYLATTLEPNASEQAAEGVALIHGSLVPEPAENVEIQSAPLPQETAPATEPAP